MLTMLWNLSAAIRGYLRFSCPPTVQSTGCAAISGLKWAIPMGLVATPAHLCLTALAIQGAARPGLGWLNVLVFLFFLECDEVGPWMAVFSLR